MPTTVETSALRAAITLLTRVARETKNPDANQAIRVTSQQDALTLTAMNAEQQISLHLPTTNSPTTHQVSYLPAKPLPALLKGFKHPDTILERNDSSVKFSSGNSKAELKGIPSGEFADEAGPLPNAVTVNTKHLNAALRRVLPANSGKNEADPTFRSVLLEVTPANLRAVASDGWRMAIHDTPGRHEAAVNFQLPNHSLSAIISLTNSNEHPTTISSNEDSVILSNKTFTATLALTGTGKFPDYHKPLNSNPTLTLTTNAKNLYDAVLQTRSFVTAKTNHRIDLKINEGTAELTSENEYGTSTQTLQAKQTGPTPELHLAFNGKFLQETLEPISSETEIILVFHELGGLLVCTNPDGSYRGVLPPLRAP